MTYTLTIHSEGHSDIPEAVRLRHVLKRLLRDYAFRCERIAVATAEAQAREQTPADTFTHRQSAERASVAGNEPCSGVPTGAFPIGADRRPGGLVRPRRACLLCERFYTPLTTTRTTQYRPHRGGQAVCACQSRCQF